MFAERTSRKRRDLGLSRAEEIAQQFTLDFPIGTPVWYWRTLPFGPVVETKVREKSFVDASGQPVIMVEGIRGYVSVFHVTTPLEAQRPYVEFVSAEHCPLSTDH